ncbi:MAG: flagellar hook-associated protein FlgL [Syntrophales bacterium]|nr:flagellar hook-associated protein FlgL [Syntrophales bacterium]MDD5531349.1 flagellar hook-associated protein FlgL [Syntrophales bacterium]
MLTRVSDNMKFRTMVNNLFSAQEKYTTLAEKMATQKNVNRPSDDPIGMSKILDYRSTKASLGQYASNVDHAESWLTMSESKLTSAEDLLIRAREIAVTQSSATASEQSRETAAVEVDSIIDELRSIANSKLGNRYIFAGTMTDTEPFFEIAGIPAIGTAEAAGGNAFDGTVASGGTYTGAVNKTYVVKIITGGTLADATYKVSSDGGATWGSEQTDLDAGTITLGDGITMTFADTGANRLAANDIFHVNALAAGYFRGNGSEMSIEVSKGTTFSYGISGEAVFTDKGSGEVDIFDVLNDLKMGLENNDADGISTQINRLKDGRDQVSKYTAMCGSRIASLDVTRTNLTAIDEKLTSMCSDIEDADLVKLATDFAMKEVALQASYAIAASIQETSILKFLG